MINKEAVKSSSWRSRIVGTATAAALLVAGGAGAIALTAPSASAHDKVTSASARSLTDRVQRLEDIEEIHQLKARYFRFVDEKKHDELIGVFTPKAKITTDGTTFKSPTVFADTIRDLIGAAPTAHSGAMPEIKITGPDTATGIWSMEDMLSFPAGPNAPEGHHGYGQYRETYKKVHGKWLIDSVVLTRFRMEPLGNWTPPKAAVGN
ncbi:nuclear transport factor 2 family protein [Streptomyces sp. NE06-03E]|uniref:nuclear transport factor 2 family protein n=1 Tax=unclassified Streptomyces TaxID=2593676 RepID=UPI0029ACB477|nr:nuclear transport factor 2 family protein [Streptomyces sp. NE06-03E]MDX3053957.1 nuclear transport factor 2 family protein [Streptomyces sp. NE06-03E]